MQRWRRPSSGSQRADAGCERKVVPKRVLIVVRGQGSLSPHRRRGALPTVPVPAPSHRSGQHRAGLGATKLGCSPDRRSKTARQAAGSAGRAAGTSVATCSSNHGGSLMRRLVYLGAAVGLAVGLLAGCEMGTVPVYNQQTGNDQLAAAEFML